MTSEKIYMDTPSNADRYASFVEMRTASVSSPESMSGIHAENLMIQCDEASKIHDSILRTLIATLTGGWNNKILLTSNGTRNSGVFYDTHMDDKAGIWSKFKCSSIDSPFTSKESILESKLKYGEDSEIYRIDVLGEFPKNGTDAFLPFSEVADAFDRDVSPNGEIELGVDVARFGDDKTVIFWRHGFKVYPPIFKGKTSVDEVVDMVKELVTKIRIQTKCEDKIRVKVDDTGLGAGVTDYLKKDRLHNIEVIPCNFGGKGNEKYANEASVMWGTIRENLKQLSLPNEQECDNVQVVKYLREELVSRRADYGTGKIKLESKDIFKREFGRSPDFADALVLCFAQKKTQRNFLTQFDALSKDFVVPRHEYLGGMDQYISVHYSNTRVSSTIWCHYGNGTIYITRDSVTDDNVARVSSEIRNNGEARKIIGNHRVFGKGSDDIRSQMSKMGVRIRENHRYDELGALELLNYIVAEKRIKISENCRDTIRQLDNWNADVKASQLETEFGLCYAILNIVSELKEHIAPKPIRQEVRKEYTNKSTLQNIDSHVGAYLW